MAAPALLLAASCADSGVMAKTARAKRLVVLMGAYYIRLGCARPGSWPNRVVAEQGRGRQVVAASASSVVAASVWGRSVPGRRRRSRPPLSVTHDQTSATSASSLVFS